MGRSQYDETWKLQKSLRHLRQIGSIDDLLLLTEHEHVYTIGKGGNDNHLLASQEELKMGGVEVYHIDRGGDITYHGPGQIVGYPIIDLHERKPDIHLYLRGLEETIILTLREFGILGIREEGLTGVWIDGEKIAAIGINVSRWITMHGFALNVNTDLARFGRIIPCGIFHKGITSIEKILGKKIPLDDVEEVLEHKFMQVFGYNELHKISPMELSEIINAAPASMQIPK
ncbi:MAG: lipoyl(octanoyl) transferase LipB [Bacteroidota bacterium]